MLEEFVKQQQDMLVTATKGQAQPVSLELSRMESFGDQSLPIDCEWPTREQLSKFPRDRMVKLNKIIYKRYNADHPITGFQLGFTNGITSEMYETEWGKENN